MNIQEQIDTNLKDWIFENNQIRKTYQFDNFVKAINFVNLVASLAEKANHHPDIFIQYSKVSITLSTHDAGEVTQKDIALASEIDSH
ncbi:MAG: 4a-hydroxytetrahydrobiopterin dehydratase [Nitrosomonadales bacterium]|jgi:4a-hydroxytetrahydrobiopterin dehydratase